MPMQPLSIYVENPVECTIRRRLNRFVVEVLVDDTPLYACINNTGRLQDYLYTGNKGFCTKNKPSLKTEYRLFAIKEKQLGALIDTQLQMKAFEQALITGSIPWLAEHAVLKRNVRLESSFIDYLLTDQVMQIYLEVKSAVLRKGRYAMYPDCPTDRGRRHIRKLIEHRANGGAAIILFIAALPDIEAFKPNRDADPELADLLITARKTGVGLRAIGLVYNPEDSRIYLYHPDLPVELC